MVDANSWPGSQLAQYIRADQSQADFMKIVLMNRTGAGQNGQDPCGMDWTYTDNRIVQAK